MTLPVCSLFATPDFDPQTGEGIKQPKWYTVVPGFLETMEDCVSLSVQETMSFDPKRKRIQ